MAVVGQFSMAENTSETNNELIMKNYYSLILIFFSMQLHGQSVDDWIWYESPFFSQSVSGLELDNNGDVWMTSGTKIIKYDGVDWLAFDLLDSGLPLANAYPRSIDASLGNRLWISTRNRVVELDLDNEEWTIHNPSPNVTGFNIKVESENRIWWTSGNRLKEYDGEEWISHFLYMPNLNMETNSSREIEIDNNNSKWITTPSSTGIEGGGLRPAGVIRLTETDTTYFNSESFGIPEAKHVYLDLDMNNNPFIAVARNGTNENYYTTYINDQWSEPIYIPFDGSIYGMELGSEDQIYVLFEEFIAIGENGLWDIIPLDQNEIHSVFSLLVTPEKDIYVAGSTGADNSEYENSFGYLPNLRYRIRGSLYSDQNYNGALDEMDQTIKNHFVQTVNQDRISFSNNEGAYSLLFADPSTYEIEGILPEYHSYGIPVNGTHSVPLTLVNPRSNGNDIGFEPDTSAIDLSISLSTINGANPGFQSCYMISVKNNAPRLTDGEVIVNFDDILNFESSDILPTSVNGNQFTFEFQEIGWLEIINIKVCFSLPPDPLLLGDTLKHNGTITPNGIDLTLENNVDTLCQLITGPFDPNNITVSPRGEEITGNIPFTTSSLEYIVHFQNIGTDTARNVIISNPIDANLDILSLNVIGFSHEYNLTFKEEGRVLEWSFNNINLPDSISNYTESNGFIRYIIDLKNNDIGTVISNKADIFFDFNLPVSTNVTINTLVEETVSTFEVFQVERCDYNVQIIEDNLQVSFPKLDKYKIGIYDMNGRRLYSSLIHQIKATISLGNLARGLYVIFITSEDCIGSGEIFVRL